MVAVTVTAHPNPPGLVAAVAIGAAAAVAVFVGQFLPLLSLFGETISSWQAYTVGDVAIALMCTAVPAAGAGRLLRPQSRWLRPLFALACGALVSLTLMPVVEVMVTEDGPEVSFIQSGGIVLVVGSVGLLAAFALAASVDLRARSGPELSIDRGVVVGLVLLTCAAAANPLIALLESEGTTGWELTRVYDIAGVAIAVAAAGAAWAAGTRRRSPAAAVIAMGIGAYTAYQALAFAIEGLTDEITDASVLLTLLLVFPLATAGTAIIAARAHPRPG